MTLHYSKIGTRVRVADEASTDPLQAVAASLASAARHGWELLPGPPQRVEVGRVDGDKVVAYLWPVVRDPVR